MGMNNWLGAFGKAEELQFSSNLELAYESALMIQGLELEYFNDRPVRTDVDLGLPKTTQAQIIRRFRSALANCRQYVSAIELHRSELDSQELRQLQLIESVVRRYGGGDSQGILRRPEALPRSLLGVFDRVRNELNPEAEASLVAGFRRRRDSTLVSLRILLLLILVPLLLQQVSRTYIVAPIIDRLAPEVPFLSYTKPQLQDAAVSKLRLYKEELEFDALLAGR